MKSWGTVLALLVFLFVSALAQAGDLSGTIKLPNQSVGASNVLVFISSATAPKPAEPNQPAQLAVADRRLKPEVLIVQPGQIVTITNAGPASYNVTFHAKDNARSNHALPANHQASIRFDKPELFIRVGDDLASLHGYVCVVDSALHAVTDAHGRFTLSDLPPGNHTVVAVHPKLGRISQDVSVAETSALVELSLPGNQSSASASARP